MDETEFIKKMKMELLLEGTEVEEYVSHYDLKSNSKKTQRPRKTDLDLQYDDEQPLIRKKMKKTNQPDDTLDAD